MEALKALPQAPTDSSSILIQHSDLGPEVALYWRVLVEHIKSLQNSDDLMDTVLPLASEFCDYVQRYGSMFYLSLMITDLFLLILFIIYIQ